MNSRYNYHPFQDGHNIDYSLKTVKALENAKRKKQMEEHKKWRLITQGKRHGIYTPKNTANANTTTIPPLLVSPVSVLNTTAVNNATISADTVNNVARMALHKHQSSRRLLSPSAVRRPGGGRSRTRKHSRRMRRRHTRKN